MTTATPQDLLQLQRDVEDVAQRFDDAVRVAIILDKRVACHLTTTATTSLAALLRLLAQIATASVQTDAEAEQRTRALVQQLAVLAALPAPLPIESLSFFALVRCWRSARRLRRRSAAPKKGPQPCQMQEDYPRHSTL